MAQRLKDEVQDRIEKGAIRVFARKGFRRARMIEIAGAAGVSTGNIYHYYRNKEDLFHAVISDRFVRDFSRLIQRRVKALDGVADTRLMGAGAAYDVASETLFRFAIEDRLRIVVLLGRSEGTRHEGFGSRLVHHLQRLALSYARTVRPRLQVTPALRFNLEQIYQNWLRTLVRILEKFETETQIREAAAAFSNYHLAGLRALLA